MIFKHSLQFLSPQIYRSSKRLDKLVNLGKFKTSQVVHREAIFFIFLCWPAE